MQIKFMNIPQKWPVDLSASFKSGGSAGVGAGPSTDFPVLQPYLVSQSPSALNLPGRARWVMIKDPTPGLLAQESAVPGTPVILLRSPSCVQISRKEKNTPQASNGEYRPPWLAGYRYMGPGWKLKFIDC